MKKKLRWRLTGVEDKIMRLIDSLRRVKDNTPSENTRTIRKLDKWIDDLIHVRNGIQNITGQLLPKLKKRLSSEFAEPDLLIVALIQSSVKNLFIELETFYSTREDAPITEAHFSDLKELSEASRTLALVGDAALDLAVLPYIWEEEIAKVGQLSKSRAEYVSNEYLADVCDRWELYDYRIHFDPDTPTKSEMNHIKGTLVEAVFGILYLYGGLDVVHKAIPSLR